MPTYTFFCSSCHHTYDEFLGMTEARPSACPSCGKKKGFGQQFTEPNAIVRGQPKTFGQAAEENAKRLGKEQMQMMAEADQERITGSKWTGPVPKGGRPKGTVEGDIPFWRDGSLGGPKMEKPLNPRKIKNVKKYVETGVM
jgi:putative FmdB family regulatory protein